MKKYTIYLIAGLMATLALLLLSSTILDSMFSGQTEFANEMYNNNLYFNCLKHHSLQLLRRHIRQRRRRLQRPALRFLHDQSARRSVVVRDCQLQHEMVEFKLPAHTHPGVSIHGYSDALKQHNKELFPIRYFIKIA